MQIKKAIIPVDLAGVVCDYEKIYEEIVYTHKCSCVNAIYKTKLL